ncbi:hypothetical protein MAR_001167 [Mya arenaria]|uniref:Uncharacterized protein n=1 Tax=Mya arenaria TaxID=6604 RepID=A0ABY7FDT6_MYAAR|nr:hypothetical protein MAR_001167 [Mya arenaria]
MNREVLGRYFNDLGTIMEGLNITNKPEDIWNCDEMAKKFEHDPVKVVVEKGSQCLSSSKSTNITIMACVNASGRRMPPIVKGEDGAFSAWI